MQFDEIKNNSNKKRIDFNININRNIYAFS